MRFLPRYLTSVCWGMMLIKFSIGSCTKVIVRLGYKWPLPTMLSKIPFPFFILFEFILPSSSFPYSEHCLNSHRCFDNILSGNRFSRFLIRKRASSIFSKEVLHRKLLLILRKFWHLGLWTKHFKGNNMSIHKGIFRLHLNNFRLLFILESLLIKFVSWIFGILVQNNGTSIEASEDGSVSLSYFSHFFGSNLLLLKVWLFFREFLDSNFWILSFLFKVLVSSYLILRFLLSIFL